MKLTWYGHSCFKAQFREGSVIFDPYSPGKVPGLILGELKADIVINSHMHGDHCYPGGVQLTGDDPAFAVREMMTFHDEKHGELRGENTVTVITGEGLTLAHLGDLGHELSDTQLAELGHIDILLVPVGGYYTIDAAQAKRVIDSIAPKIAVPMHYRRGEAGLAPIAELDDFARLIDSEKILYLQENSIEIDAQTPAGVYVFPWPKN